MANAQAVFLAEQALITGQVINQVGEGFRIRTSTGFQEAHVAASCVVMPSLGSEVLIVQGQEHYFILAVLTRPASTLKLEAKKIELVSEQLKISNTTTELKSNQLRLDLRRFVALAKRAYFEFKQLWQKADTTYLEAKHYKLKTKYLAEETEGLRFSQAEVVTHKSIVNAIQADKFLVN